MEDTSGFYKWDAHHKEWWYGPNMVIGIHTDVIGVYLNLERELKDTYEYPVDGWNWYDERPADPE